MADSERTDLRHEVARLVRKIARVLGDSPEQRALLTWADQVENSTLASSGEKAKRRPKQRSDAVTTRLH